MLGAVGISAEQEQAYVVVLRAGEAAPEDVAVACNRTTAQARRVLVELAALGLVSQTSSRPRRYVPAQPDLALETLIIQRQQELARTRQEVQRLVAVFDASRGEIGSATPVELVSGGQAVGQRYLQLQASAREQVRMFDKPPYIDMPPHIVSGAANATELEGLRRGVSYRIVYDTVSFEDAAKRQWMLDCVAAGEQARILGDLPCKLHIADDRLAMTYNVSGDAITSAIVVHPSPLLDAVIRLFELAWGRASAVAPKTPSPLPFSVQEVLRLLAAGLKDEAIARQLGLHLRTVRRHAATALAELGASNRLQAGAEAARREWI